MNSNFQRNWIFIPAGFFTALLLGLGMIIAIDRPQQIYLPERPSFGLPRAPEVIEACGDLRSEQCFLPPIERDVLRERVERRRRQTLERFLSKNTGVMLRRARAQDPFGVAWQAMLEVRVAAELAYDVRELDDLRLLDEEGCFEAVFP